MGTVGDGPVTVGTMGELPELQAVTTRSATTMLDLARMILCMRVLSRTIDAEKDEVLFNYELSLGRRLVPFVTFRR